MAWEQRGAQTYSSRSVRSHGRVTKACVGTGPVAPRSAAEDTECQAQGQAEAEGWRQEQAALDAFDRQRDAWWNAGRVLRKAWLGGDTVIKGDAHEPR
jgi:hypothetical protein